MKIYVVSWSELGDGGWTRRRESFDNKKDANKYADYISSLSSNFYRNVTVETH